MIWLCVVSRDGRIQDEVLIRANAAQQHAEARGIRCELSIVKYPYGVAACRNKAVYQFLKSRNDRLFFVDDDVLIPDHAATELLKVDADIAMGCYPSLRLDNKGGFTKFLAIRKRKEDWSETWFDGVVDADSGGAGCMMIRRNAFEQVGFPWFDWKETLTPTGIVLQSEDCDFCDRAIAAGLTIKANGNVRCGHLKTIDVARLLEG